MEVESTQVVMSFRDLQVSGEHNNVSFSQVIQIMASEIKTREFKSNSPYPGFQHFDESDSQRFFGRGQVVSDLLRTLIKNVFMVVAGGSGSGKSSVVRAGLIPALSDQLPKDQFRRFVWTPDVRPFRGLYISLVSQGHIPQAEAEVAEPHEPSRSTLADAVAKLAKPHEQWLLFIDRFEELFTMTPEQERVVFMDALVHLIKNPPEDVGLKVVVAMRSDYLDRIGYFPEFAQLVRRNLRMVTSLHPDELRQIIERPAAEHGVVIVANFFERDGLDTFDTSPVIDANGVVLGMTRMVHITDYACFHEQGYYTPGDTGAPVYDTRFGKIGVAICYDRHFPEYMRALALDGADLVVVPQAGTVGEFPDGLYEAEMRVTALQNGYHVALCNRVGAEDCVTFSGESFVCGPFGDVIARAPQGQDHILHATIDPGSAYLAPARKLYLRHRRPELYADWVGRA